MGIIDDLKKRISNDIDELSKAEVNKVEAQNSVVPANEMIGSKALIDDPYYDYYTRSNFYKQKGSRLSNTMLKTISLRDWLVSAILQIRCDTMAQFGRIQDSVFDTGFKIEKYSGEKHYTEEELKEVHFLENFILHCGRTENTPIEDQRTFDVLLKLWTRDALTFGYVTAEKVLTRKGSLHRLRPLPAETMFLIDKKQSREAIEQQFGAAKQYFQPRPGSNDPSLEYQVNEAEIEYIKYCQVSADLRPMKGFGDEDLIFELFNPQNFADSAGYCYSPLELGIMNIMNHMKLDTFNINFFTYGYAAKGLIHLKGTVTQAQLASFRRHYYNSISGSQNAWRTPIVAGLDDVQWVPMSASSRDMEYLNYNNMIMRSICSQFQIDPIELGLDYLVSATGKSPSQQANNKFKIEYSKERGLYPLLAFFANVINHRVLPVVDKELAKKYKFVFKGYTDETPQTKVALQQAQIALFKTLNDIRSENRLELIDEPLANIPLNAQWINTMRQFYTMGELREKFLGDKDASKNPALQYIPGDAMFIQWNQLVQAKANIDYQAGVQKEQIADQKEQMEQQQEQQTNMEGQEASPEEEVPEE